MFRTNNNVFRMPRLSIRKALLFGFHLRVMVQAEESSILKLAKVKLPINGQMPDPEGFLNGSFKEWILAASVAPITEIEVEFNLKSAARVHTVFILNFDRGIGHIGTSAIYLVKDGIETLQKLIYDTGIYKLENPTDATSIIIRRVYIGGGCQYWLNHMRAYQSINLLSKGATIHYETPSVDGNTKAQNLIDNPESRSPNHTGSPRLSESERAAFKSCYRADKTTIKADGDQMKLVIDFQVISFIHAILIVDEIIDSYRNQDITASHKNNWLQNLNFYIGNDSEIATNNQLVKGGPFLDVTDPKNYLPSMGTTDKWRYGQEIWPNLEGRYLHIIANPNRGALQYNFTQTICQLAVFGTIYTRAKELEQNITIVPGQTTATITIPHIYADSSRPIGNILAIKVRQASDLDVQIFNTGVASILTIDTRELVVDTTYAETYELVIESYDENSTDKSTLKTDRFNLKICPECDPFIEEIELEIISPSFVSEPEHQILKLSQLSKWTLPEIDEGSFPPAEVQYSLDSKIASLFEFDSKRHTISFDGQDVENKEEFYGKLFLNRISIVDSQANVVSYTQSIEIQDENSLCETSTGETGKNCEELSVIVEQDLKTESEEQTSQEEEKNSQAEKQTIQDEEQTSQAQKQTKQEKEQTKKEENFTMKWVPSINLQSEEDIKDLVKSIDDINDLIEDEVKNGGRPLEVRFGLMDSIGKVELIFSEAMQFPDDLEQLIIDSQGKKDAIIEVSLIGPGNWMSSNIQSWSIESVTSKKIVFIIKYKQPLKVSEDQVADRLFLQIRMSQWTDIQDRSLPVLVGKFKEIPRQAKSITEAESVGDLALTGTAATTFLGPLNTLLMILAQASLNQLWGAINSQQVVLQMPMMKNVKYPANALIFTMFLMEIANLDLIPTEIIEDIAYYLPEPIAFSINFEACGMESTLLISNIGSALLVIFLYALVSILTAVLYKVKRVWNKLGPVIYWNGLIRLFLELYQDLAMLCYLNITQANWDSVYQSERYSNSLAATFFAIILVVPLILLAILYYREWKDQKFQDQFGTLLEGTDIEKNDKKVSVTVLLIFLLRRLAIVFSMVALEDFLWGQIALQVFFSLGNMIFIQWFQPLESKFANLMETFNEICILQLTYTAMCFTDFVPDPEIRNELGLYYIGLNSSMISVHLAVLSYSSVKACKLNRKMKKFEKMKQEYQARALAKEQAKIAREKQLKIIAENKALDVIEEEKSGERSNESQGIEEEKSGNKSIESYENQIVEEPSKPLTAYMKYIRRIEAEKKSRKIAQEALKQEKLMKKQKLPVDPEIKAMQDLFWRDNRKKLFSQSSVEEPQISELSLYSIDRSIESEENQVSEQPHSLTSQTDELSVIDAIEEKKEVKQKMTEAEKEKKINDIIAQMNPECKLVIDGFKEKYIGPKKLDDSVDSLDSMFGKTRPQRQMRSAYGKANTQRDSRLIYNDDVEDEEY